MLFRSPPRGNPDLVPRAQPSPATPIPAPAAELAAPPASANRQEPELATATTPSGEDPAVLQQRAISSVQQLYDALAARDYERARGYVSPQAADQFDPNYLEQYQQVAIQDLRVTGQTGTSIQLEGVVSLQQPDGSRHLETRSFSVEAASEPARVTASAFGRALR